MTGIIVLAVLVLVVIAALESSNRRHATGLSKGPNGAWAADDRDLARSKLDLLALGDAAEPFTHKPMTRHHTLRPVRQFGHLGHHGRHAV